MNTEELDAFFAKADDVLADWPGSVDSMDTTKETAADWPDLLAQAFQSVGAEMQRLVDALRANMLVESGYMAALAPKRATPPVDNPALALIEARRHRNTGPVNRVGLDGRRRIGA